MKEKTYTVGWFIDVDATSPEAAAEQAETLLLTADNQTAWQYQVAPCQEIQKMKGEVSVVVTKGVGRRVK
jgi:hypothetical protein